MEIKINVYKDCASEEPSKTFVVRRILFKTAKEIGSLQEEAKNASESEQEAFTLKMLQCVIPEFKKEDLDGIDPIELGAFFRELGGEVAKVVDEARKN